MGICAFIGNYMKMVSFIINDLYTYNVNISFVEYYGSISAIRYNWKDIIVGETIELDRIWSEIVGKNKAKNKPCKYFYKLFIQITKQEPVKCHKQIVKWF
jgi:hypothetical protein